jgi:alkylhydroperoxidase/carboxymuconolactone decarboxylase family protein YurZ
LNEHVADSDVMGVARREALSVDYTDLLRRLSLHDERVAAANLSGADTAPLGPDSSLDPKTLALVRLAALVAVGGAVPSYGAQTDAAVDTGATVDEIVGVLVGVISVVGLPRVVAAAPKVALALGHDVEDVEILPGG